MKIIACIKRVPTTDFQPRVGSDGKSLDPSGVQYMTSFYDEIAVEEALRIKEKQGGEVTVLTIGPSEASKELREAYVARARTSRVYCPGATRRARASLPSQKPECAPAAWRLPFTSRATARPLASSTCTSTSDSSVSA